MFSTSVPPGPAQYMAHRKRSVNVCWWNRSQKELLEGKWFLAIHSPKNLVPIHGRSFLERGPLRGSGMDGKMFMLEILRDGFMYLDGKLRARGLQER